MLDLSRQGNEGDPNHSPSKCPLAIQLLARIKLQSGAIGHLVGSGGRNILSFRLNLGEFEANVVN